MTAKSSLTGIDRRRRFLTGGKALVTLQTKDHSDSEMDSLSHKQPKLTKEEYDAIKDYSGSAYTEINKVLYDIDSNGLNPWEKGQYIGPVKQSINNIESATNHKIDKPLTLYRGENIKAIERLLGTKSFKFTDSMIQSLAGKVMEFKGFASTAYKADNSFHYKPVFIEIDAPKGVQGRIITGESAYGHDESEVLLHNSGGLHIKKAYRDKNGQIIIKAKYIY